ncbi:MAG: alkylation response protein AidB-like acyl-CoA dehydrogenase [Oceanicoccus sp.]|jgi:alkylation response protein AidB-like acyl-CoA dehydrogenase
MSTNTHNELTAARLLDHMSNKERAIAAKVDAILPALSEKASAADIKGEFPVSHVQLFSDAGLLGLMVPEAYGGLGGGLRDLSGATFAMGSACPSTALAFFFHCSAASRGTLQLKAIDAGLFKGEEAKTVKAFADKVLYAMGRDGKWLANFASESNKKATAMLAISTTASKVDGGWRVNGVKSFGCAVGVADEYLVTAKLEGYETAEGLATFFVKRDAKGVSPRVKWDAIGMRACANHGLILEDVFVADEDALGVPGAFVKSMQMSRGTFVGNQPAGTCCYLGAAQSIYDFAIRQLNEKTFSDTGRPIGEGPAQQELIGKMTVELETAYAWMRRQIDLESSDVEILPKPIVERQWHLAKGTISEACFAVGTNALKACGTANTMNTTPIARGIRNLTMGLVQAFPAEAGRLYAAKDIISKQSETLFST